MKKILRTALFVAVISCAVMPAFADDPGGTIPPPNALNTMNVIYVVLSLFGF
jgi:hypothetical protein